jgi:hypothetical protein
MALATIAGTMTNASLEPCRPRSARLFVFNRTTAGALANRSALDRKPGVPSLALSHYVAGRRRQVVASATEVQLLNRTDRPSPMPGEAEVKYLDGDFRVVRPGAFVRCAVTGLPIPLEELRYWSVDLQEAYVSPEAALQRHGSLYTRRS